MLATRCRDTSLFMSVRASFARLRRCARIAATYKSTTGSSTSRSACATRNSEASKVRTLCSNPQESLSAGRCREIENQINAYCSNCKVTLTATHRLKPSRNPNSQEGSITAYSLPLAAKRNAFGCVAFVPASDAKILVPHVLSIRGAINPHTTRIMNAPTIAPMNPAP